MGKLVSNRGEVGFTTDESLSPSREEERVTWGVNVSLAIEKEDSFGSTGKDDVIDRVVVLLTWIFRSLVNVAPVSLLAETGVADISLLGVLSFDSTTMAAPSLAESIISVLFNRVYKLVDLVVDNG